MYTIMLKLYLPRKQRLHTYSINKVCLKTPQDSHNLRLMMLTEIKINAVSRQP